MGEEVRAYAKIVGPGWEYYMTQPKIILGRGGDGVQCDVVISREQAVSRQHFTIRFSPELQAFEVENLSKNGILVNGEFVQRYSPPALLRSQADIAFGRMDPMRISFLLPVGSKGSVKKREPAADRNIPLLQWIGEAIVTKGCMPPERIRKAIDMAHPNQLQKLGSERIIASSIRHILTQNEHVFCVVSDGPSMKEPVASFDVRQDQKSRFYSLISVDEQEMHRNGVCRDTKCRTIQPPRSGSNGSS